MISSSLISSGRSPSRRASIPFGELGGPGGGGGLEEGDDPEFGVGHGRPLPLGDRAGAGVRRGVRTGLLSPSECAITQTNA